ncbi:MAG: pentapeptide repeat-containing protein, partial [Waterburya sp.]
MLRRSRLSIPHELHQIKAQQIYEQRVAKGKNGSPEGDWETARRYLTRYPKVVRAWKRKQAIAFYRQLPRSFFRRLARSFKALINGIWKIITFPLWLFDKLPQLFANADTRPFALDVVTTIISAASLIAAIIAAIGLFVNYQDALKDRKITQERLVTDRFAKAIEQLGNKQEEVVIGGIYSLERIAKDSPKDQWTIMEVLTAFVRKNSPIPPEIQNLKEKKERSKALEKLDPVNIQIQAALTVIGRRDPEQDDTSEEDSVRRNPEQDDTSKEDPVKRLDLNYSNLRDADLSGANLRDADLSGANLRDADLSGA